MDNELTAVQNGDELVLSDDEENLFDDYEPTEDTPVEDGISEPVQESSTEPEAIDAPVENPFELKIKFNGEEKSLNEEEARTLAQKGMNYDRFYEPIERLARLNGMSVGDYINQLNETQVQYEIANEVDRLREDPKYQGVNDDILTEIATERVNKNIETRENEYQEQLQGEADAKQEQVKRDVELFFEEYPEFRNQGPDALDPKVYEYVNKGYTLLEAYNKWTREQDALNKPQADTEQKISRLNEENKKKSLGNTSNAGSVEGDDFLKGFLSN